MAVRTYDPKQCLVTIGGVPMGGFADGTFVSIERTSDTFTKVSGADGIVSRSKTNDKSGTLTLTLAQTSPSNDVLTGYAKLDELSNAGIIPVTVKDISGRSTYASGFGWVKKPPTGEFGKEISDREWSLDMADLEIYTGGNADIGV